MTETRERIEHLLTDKEKALCVAICEGKSNKEITTELGFKSVQVAKNQMRFIYKKLGVDGRMKLAIMLFRHGIVECPCGATKKEVDRCVA